MSVDEFNVEVLIADIVFRCGRATKEMIHDIAV